MNIHIDSYEKFLDRHTKYNGSQKCCVCGCDKPAYFEGGDARCYCPMCEEHAQMKESYHLYLKNIERRLRVRFLWDKANRDGIQAKMNEVMEKLRRIER